MIELSPEIQALLALHRKLQIQEKEQKMQAKSAEANFSNFSPFMDKMITDSTNGHPVYQVDKKK